MQPLKMLTCAQKAILLHNLFPNEIPEFLGFLNELTETVLNDKERITAEWRITLFEVNSWFNITEGVQAKMFKYREELYKNANVFANELFDNHISTFCVHALVKYTVLGKYVDAKFKTAVNLFFIDDENGLFFTLP